MSKKGSYGIGRGPPVLMASFVHLEMGKGKGHEGGGEGHGSGASCFREDADPRSLDCAGRFAALTVLLRSG